MNPSQAVGALIVAGATLLTLAGPAQAGHVQNHKSEYAAMAPTHAEFRTLHKAFQKIAGPHILTDGTLGVWTADPGEVADSTCEATVTHRSWGKQEIGVTHAVCGSLYGSTVGYGVLLSKDKRYLGLILVDSGGNSGRLGYELLVFKLTSSPMEGGQDGPYYAKIKQLSL